MKIKNLYLIIILSIFVFACKPEDEAVWNKIKDTKDFNVIESFIVQNTNTKSFSEGIELILKLKQQKDDTPEIPTYPNYYGRNATRIIINENSELKILSETFNGNANSYVIEQMYNDYFSYRKNQSDFPETKQVKIKNKDIPISKGYFFLIIDKNAKMDTTREVIMILNDALNNYKHKLIKTFFTENSKKLDEELTNALDSLLKNRIKIFDMKQHEETFPNKVIEINN